MKKFKNVTEVLIKSTKDGTSQPNLIYKAKGKNRPLIVVLHTWSFNRFNQVENFLPYAKKHDVNIIFPEFRGANIVGNPNKEQACCSSVAIQDIFDSIEYFKQNHTFDEQNLFITGASGGGLMALMVCANNPTYFKGVQAIVPITDLVKWYAECEPYRNHLKYCLGGEPLGETLMEYKNRSPINYVENLAKANLRICSGKSDGVVHYSHGLTLYNKIVEHNPNAKTYLEIFDGEHEQNVDSQFSWILSQINKKQLTKVTG